MAVALPEHWREWVLGLLAGSLLAWVASQAWGMRTGGKAPPPGPSPVVCAECGWHGSRVVHELPCRCPRCHRVAVHFAGVCPECGEWTPWDAAREEILFARPRLFRSWGPQWFFPRCRACGAPTNATGEKPQWEQFLEHKARIGAPRTTAPK